MNLADFPSAWARRRLWFLETLRGHAAQGLTTTEIAERMGFSYPHIHRLSKMHDIAVAPGRRGQPRHVDLVRLERIAKRLAAGKTLREIGNELGITAERVRQLQVAHGLPNQQEARYAKKEREAAAAKLTTLLERMQRAQPCVVCGAWVVRSERNVTCSPECADMWIKARYQLSDEHRRRQTIHNAQSVLRHPEKYQQRVIHWAVRVLSGDWEPNRRYIIPGKAPAEILERLGKNGF